MRMTLDELINAMEPQARKDKALISKCVDGLTEYAAELRQKAGDAGKEQISALRRLVDELAGYWGLDAKTVDHVTAFDRKIQEVDQAVHQWTPILVLCAMLVIALAVRIFPVFVAKQQLDTFATELIREAEIAGRVGSETDRREQALREQTGLNPDISWSRTGRIQLNQEVAVTVTYETNIGLFSGFGSFPITLRADATGKSEVYWK